MATYYVGPGGNDGSAGTSWGARKLTIQAAVNVATTAGDTVYVAPGVYRETCTLGSSGSAGNVISLIGDYTGANTSGTKGVVRITGSNNDITATRANCITATSKSYALISGFCLDIATTSLVNLTSCDHVTVSQCLLNGWGSGNSTKGVNIDGASQSTITVKNCAAFVESNGFGVDISHSSTLDNIGHVVESLLILGGAATIRVQRVGGLTVRNCTLGRASDCVSLAVALNAGQTLTVNNSIIFASGFGLRAVANDGTFVENYNNVAPGNAAARSNVTAGANSVSRAPSFDTRWFFEMINGGRMVTPFDLASYSTLVEYNSGTGAPSTDMRGASVVGTYREWGALEYDANYGISGKGVSINPIGGTIQ